MAENPKTSAEELNTLATVEEVPFVKRVLDEADIQNLVNRRARRETGMNLFQLTPEQARPYLR